MSAPVLAATQLVPVLTGLSSPAFVTHAGDGSQRLFVVEQTGDILVRQPQSFTTTVFIDIRGKVMAGGERGLLGLAFHPDYATNGLFYLHFSSNASQGLPASGDTVVAEFTANADRSLATITSHARASSNPPPRA